ncbi:glycosyltransferase family 9 protein [Betaproteobacteria bacterium]|nr:glycosyltransferase family 9 protein [Betaproteobacteria bacterium]
MKKGSFLSFINILLSFIRYLRKERFDLVLDLQGLFRTNFITFFCKSNLKYSLGTEFPGNLLVKNIIPRKHNSNRISSEYLFLAEYLKLTTDKFNPRFYITSSIIKPSVCPIDTTKEPFFVIFPFTTRRQKHWKPEFWAQLIKNLICKYKTKCIVLGRALNNEQKILEEQLISVGAFSLVNKTNLKDVPNLIKQSQFAVGVDTGLTHISLSIGNPTIAIFGSTRPYTNPVIPTTKVLWLGLECSPCGRNPICNDKFSCMTEITPSLVARHLDTLINSNAKNKIT